MADLTGAERVIVDAWIPSAIGTVAIQLESISKGLSSRVYLDMAPDGTTYPFIVFQTQDDPTNVRGVGIVTIMVTTLYLVKVVAATDYISIGNIVALIDTVLTTATGAAPSIGGRVLS